MAAPRDARDVVRALLGATPKANVPVRQAVVDDPASDDTVTVNVLLDPTSPPLTVRRFAFVTLPAPGDVVWLLRVGSTYVCLGALV
jgi:predicted regulator of amino acid metabolism with ACT domain